MIGVVEGISALLLLILVEEEELVERRDLFRELVGDRVDATVSTIALPDLASCFLRRSSNSLATLSLFFSGEELLISMLCCCSSIIIIVGSAGSFGATIVEFVVVSVVSIWSVVFEFVSIATVVRIVFISLVISLVASPAVVDASSL